MKATPELLELALRGIGIGTNLETCYKILATVRLLEVKGDAMDLKDIATIEACYTEKIEPQGEPLPSNKVDLSLLEEGDIVAFRDGKEKKVSIVSQPNVANKYEIDLSFNDGSSAFYMNDGSFWVDKSYCLEDIIKIIKPTKPQ